MTEASRLIGKSKQTLYRHVSSGRVSRNSDGFLDTAELIRVYGELKQNTTSKVTKTSVPVVQVERSHIEWLEKQVDGLMDDIKQVRDDSLTREIRLMALLEHKFDTTQSETSSDEPVIRVVFSKLFK
ncbi:hypothetical protein BJAS_P4151 [Bathymodiolus japonicus methanotrophic gill symbiont]|uniref:hypothetical protein n=1 Tax=Bathymodiolus japonicus methanotrophic gill symbiont TaxID=113269 RepID=UPI001B67B314|nr:hypothetical protein [Bathymodiolus japonicus methanotrophic gill symbiont]GFO73380.1 hypothetical protein BJAS_P4151 [Bathymodiolus japonicus methanotrophic gill symbiont]